MIAQIQRAPFKVVIVDDPPVFDPRIFEDDFQTAQARVKRLERRLFHTKSRYRRGVLRRRLERAQIKLVTVTLTHERGT